MNDHKQELPDGYQRTESRGLSAGVGQTSCGIARNYSVARMRDPNKSVEQQYAEMREELRRMIEGETFGDGAGI